MIGVAISSAVLCAPCLAQSIPCEVKAFVPTLNALVRTKPDLEAARQLGMQADVQVLLTVDPGGLVVTAEALTGPAALRSAATDAARNWTFHPVMPDGAAVCAMTNEIVSFLFPGGGPRTPFNAAENLAASQRTLALMKAFPRTPALVFSDLQSDVDGITGLPLFLQLPHMAKAAIDAGQVSSAVSYANELLSMAGQAPYNQNNGQAIHDGNVVLGRAALLQNNVNAAGEYLSAAGRTRGSPALNSFGPNMSLAKALIESNQREVVLAYFDLCRNFWTHSKQLDDWTATVKGGGMPQFGANLLY